MQQKLQADFLPNSRMPYQYQYPHPAVTTDNVVFCFDREETYVLLIQRAKEPCKGCWAFPGGFVEIGESCEEGAARELCEETGLEGVPLEQFHTFSAPDRDPRERIITVAYLTLIPYRVVEGGDDAREARWWSLKSLPELAFDHEEMLWRAVKRLEEIVSFDLETGLGIRNRFTKEDLECVRRTLVEKLSKMSEEL